MKCPRLPISLWYLNCMVMLINRIACCIQCSGGKTQIMTEGGKLFVYDHMHFPPLMTNISGTIQLEYCYCAGVEKHVAACPKLRWSSGDNNVIRIYFRATTRCPCQRQLTALKFRCVYCSIKYGTVNAKAMRKQIDIYRLSIYNHIYR